MLKNKTLKICFSVGLICLFLMCFFIYFYIQKKISKTEKLLLSYADNIISEEVVGRNSTIKSIKENNEIIDDNKFDNINNNNLDNSNQDNEENLFQDTIKKNNNIFGKIVIDKIGVNAPIMDGTDQGVLRASVGHFKETSYWNGNVALASHNRGSYAHYFEKINQLNIGDEIKYQTELGTRVYSVKEITEVSEQNLSVLEGTKDNTLTLITCIKNKPELRLCVKAIEKT